MKSKLNHPATYLRPIFVVLLWSLGLPCAWGFTPDSRAEVLNLDIYTAGLTLAYNHYQYPEISTIDKNSEAWLAGINLGDRVISIDDQIAAFMGADQLRNSLTMSHHRKIQLEIERGSDNQHINVSFYPVKGSALADSALARLLCSQKPFYPVKTQQLQTGFYAIDLPSFLRHEASESPIVLEFYNSAQGPSVLLNARIRALNNNLKSEGEPLIALISISLQDQNTLVLREHFRMTNSGYIFVGSDSQVIKDYVDVARHALSADELDERLTEMIDLKDQSLNMVPLLMPSVASHWREITNHEIELTQKQ